MSGILKKLIHGCGLVTKSDLSEYARRFISGEDLPTEGDSMLSPDAAMRISAVYACVMIRSQTMASLPLTVYERTESGGQREAPEHPVAQLLAAPNRYQTTFEWVQQQTACLDLRGNGVSLKVREGGRVVQLVPVHPSRVQIEEYADGLIAYRITTAAGRQLRLLSEDVLHIPGMVMEGYWALSPIAAARDAIVLARKIQKYGISVLDTGGAKRVLLKFPNALGDEARKNLKRSWEENGKDSARTAILEEGGDAVAIGMNADEAQYLETRQMSIADIARIYTMPLMLLGVHDKTSSYASTEQFDLLFGKHTIRPICKRIEARIDRYLINEGVAGDGRFFCKFNMDALLRGDIKTRTEALWRQMQGGALTIDEWRQMENRNPMGGEIGSAAWIPSNMMPAERALKEPEPADPTRSGASTTPAEPESPQEGSGGVGGSDNAERAILSPFARDIAARLVRSWMRGPAKCSRWEEYQQDQRRYAYRAMEPLLRAAGVEDTEARAACLATEMTDRLEPGVEIDPENREKEIFAILMSVVTQDAVASAGWLVESVKARRDQESS